MKLDRGPGFNLISALALSLLFVWPAALRAQTNTESQQDPNRPPCTSARCKVVESFLKAHYCGDSPAGNGPDNGCELLPPKKQPAGIDVLASYDCTFDQKTGQDHCAQHGQPSVAIRDILTTELGKVGLPANAPGQIAFTIWKYRSSGWIVADASYSRLARSSLDLCQVIVRIDKDSHVLVLRKCPFKNTDADVPDVTEWTLADVADIERSGQPDIILEGDAYEDHWFEVVSVHDGKCETIFSGLGYYL